MFLGDERGVTKQPVYLWLRWLNIDASQGPTPVQPVPFGGF